MPQFVVLFHGEVLAHAEGEKDGESNEDIGTPEAIENKRKHGPVGSDEYQDKNRGRKTQLMKIIRFEGPNMELDRVTTDRDEIT